tara:strand:+ start:1517 stop:1951 length:435 start_codon:yes stop_codon:yes gene_type:complete
MSKSKPLIHDDSSGFDFVKEILDGDPTCAINFDRLQHHPELGYIIFEYLLCDEKQMVNPWTSHPNRYWNKNKRKFISLFEVAKDLPAKLILVNYAKINTTHSDKIKVIEVLSIDSTTGIVDSKETNMTRGKFKSWFRNLNKECL